MQIRNLAAVAAYLAGRGAAHSWVEQAAKISEDGNYVGEYGYMRGYVDRDFTGWDPVKDVQNLVPNGPNQRISESTLVCKDNQQTSNYNNATFFPKLKASSGDYIALKYLENGHTTLADLRLLANKVNGSAIYVFGTAEPKEKETFGDILQWNSEGTGGDKRGKLLTAQDFDDKRCHQMGKTPVALERIKEFPNDNHELWCETDVPLPKDIIAGKTYTLYWVWDWPSTLGDFKDEYYTSCLDIDVVGTDDDGTPSKKNSQQDPNTKAVSDYKSRTASSPVPRSPGSSPTGSVPLVKESSIPTTAVSSAGTAPSATPPPSASDGAIPTLPGRPGQGDTNPSPTPAPDAGGMVTVTVKETVYVTGDVPAASTSAAALQQNPDGGVVAPGRKRAFRA